MTTTRLSVTGMTCDHCVAKVEKALKAVGGVYAVVVDRHAGFAEVDHPEGTAPADALVAAVQQAGYAAAVAD